MAYRQWRQPGSSAVRAKGRLMVILHYDRKLRTGAAVGADLRSPYTEMVITPRPRLPPQ